MQSLNLQIIMQKKIYFFYFEGTCIKNLIYSIIIILYNNSNNINFIRLLKSKRWMFPCGATSAAKWFSTYRRYDESDIFYSAGRHTFPLPFDLASRLFHRAFCTRHLFRLASFFLGLADLRRQGKVICCLSHEAEAVSFRGEEHGGMNTIAVANINFYFRARERISPAFKVIPILDDEK